VHTGFWWGNLREGEHLEDLGLDGRMILNVMFKKLDGEAWTGWQCPKMVLVNALMNLRVS
jgi:hypothetical protein